MKNESNQKYQITPASMAVFGIKINSRHGIVSEIKQMIKFAEQVNSVGCACHVQEVFYDSPAQLCSFELTADANQNELHKIYSCAKETIVQFEWNGLCDHINGCEFCEESDEN